MSVAHWIVTALVRLYPRTWRREYGPELADMLHARPLGPRIVADVLWNGLWQRAASAEPSTLLGLAMMLVVLSRLVWILAAPPPYGPDWATLLQPSLKALPTIVVEPLTSELYVLLLVSCGCWTALRSGDTPPRPGMAAMKVSFVAGIPIMLAGVLMLAGVIDRAVLGSGETPAPLTVLVSPLFALPVSWIWGTVGGALGHRISQARRNRDYLDTDLTRL